MKANPQIKTCLLFSHCINNATTHGLRAIAPLLTFDVINIEDISVPDEWAGHILILSDYGITQLPAYETIPPLPTIMELRGDVIAYEYAPFLKSAEQQQQLIDFANKTYAVITPSEASRNKLISAGIDEQKIHVFRRGVAGPFTPSSEYTLPEILTLTTVASLSWSKGHDRILATAKEMKQQGISFKWVLIGDGPNHEWLNFEINRLSLHDHVIPLWQLNQTQIQEQLAQSHFFIQMPYSDDLGYCAMEASAQGIPVISTATGAIPEIYTHDKNAILFDYQDADHAAKIIQSAYQDIPTCHLQAQAANNMVCKQYTLKQYAEGYIALLAQCTENISSLTQCTERRKIWRL